MNTGTPTCTMCTYYSTNNHFVIDSSVDDEIIDVTVFCTRGNNQVSQDE